MPDPLISQFSRVFNSPIETNRQLATTTERNNIPSGVRWEGMIVYVVSEQNSYQLVGGVDNGSWELLGGLQDAPSDGQTYGRKDGNWELIPDGGVDWGDIGGVLSAQTDLQGALDAKLSDAPINGNIYGRLDGGWGLISDGGTYNAQLFDSGGGASYTHGGGDGRGRFIKIGKFIFFSINLFDVQTAGTPSPSGHLEFSIPGTPIESGTGFILTRINYGAGGSPPPTENYIPQTFSLTPPNRGIFVPQEGGALLPSPTFDFGELQITGCYISNT